MCFTREPSFTSPFSLFTLCHLTFFLYDIRTRNYMRETQCGRRQMTREKRMICCDSNGNDLRCVIRTPLGETGLEGLPFRWSPKQNLWEEFTSWRLLCYIHVVLQQGSCLSVHDIRCSDNIVFLTHDYFSTKQLQMKQII